MKGLWTSWFAILILGGTASAVPLAPCGVPPSVDSVSANFSALSQMAGCLQKTPETVDGTSAFTPLEQVTNAATLLTQASPFSSPVPTLALENLAKAKFPSPVDQLRSDSPSAAGVVLDQSPVPSRAFPQPEIIIVTLLGAGVLGLGWLVAARNRRGEHREHPLSSSASGAGVAALQGHSAEIIVLEPAEPLPHAGARRCRYCESDLVRPSQRQNLVEARILPLFFVAPFRCLSCGRRYYTLAS
jgi:hypothetical protein